MFLIAASYSKNNMIASSLSRRLSCFARSPHCCSSTLRTRVVFCSTRTSTLTSISTASASRVIAHHSSRQTQQQKQQDEKLSLLKRHLSQAVQNYIQETYSYAAWQEHLRQTRRAAAAASKRRPWHSSTTITTTCITSDNNCNYLETLTRLAGFSKTTAPSTVLALAEGVVAKPNKNNTAQEEYQLYNLSHKHVLSLSSSSLSSSSWLPKRRSSSPPALIPADITLYRILENRAEQWLQRRQQAMQTWIQQRITQPARRIQQQVSNATTGIINTATDSDMQSNQAAPTSLNLQRAAASTTLSNNSANDDDSNKHVVLRVQLSTGDLALFTHIQVPQHTTLLLPYTLGHKPASTLIQVSFVVFGALPLVYRSVQFMYAYPLLQHGIVASVVATVAYGIWSSRVAARTNQALAVITALQPRTVAQHGAAWLVLQAAASQRLVQVLLEEWLLLQQVGENDIDSFSSFLLTSNDDDDHNKNDNDDDALIRHVAMQLIERWGLASTSSSTTTPTRQTGYSKTEDNTMLRPVSIDVAIRRFREHALSTM